MNDITMTTDINLTIDTDTAALEAAEAAENARFEAEVTEFLNSLPEPTAEDNARYEEKMAYLAEIRKQIGLDKEVIIEDTDDSVPYRGKYCDHAYSVSL